MPWSPEVCCGSTVLAQGRMQSAMGVVGESEDDSAIARMLAECRRHIDRVEPEHLERELAGALVVDIRLIAQRSADGDLPGAVLIDRNVLEWRLDPTSPYRWAGLRRSDSPHRHCLQRGIQLQPGRVHAGAVGPVSRRRPCGRLSGLGGASSLSAGSPGDLPPTWSVTLRQALCRLLFANSFDDGVPGQQVAPLIQQGMLKCQVRHSTASNCIHQR
jgi:hypothetical protein